MKPEDYESSKTISPTENVSDTSTNEDKTDKTEKPLEDTAQGL